MLLAPLLAGERWSLEPGLVAGLAVSLAVVPAGTYSLAATRVVGRVVASD